MASLTFYLALLPILVTTSEWPGFRGATRYGAAEVEAGPLAWSTSKNIRWSVEIPGDGNSSPVISKGRVFVTSSYVGARDSGLGSGARIATFLLAALMAGATASVLAHRHTGARTGTRGVVDFASQAAFGVCAGVAFILIIFGNGLIDFERCPIRQWLTVSLVVSLCLVMMLQVKWGGFRQYAIISGLAFGFACLVVWGMPSKDHAFRGGLSFRNAKVVCAAAAIPLLVSVSCLINAAYGLRRRSDGSRVPGKMPWGLVPLYTMMAVTGIAIGMWVGVGLILGNGEDRAGNPWPALGTWSVLVVFSTACWCLPLFPLPRSVELVDRSSLRRTAKSAVLLVLCTVISLGLAVWLMGKAVQYSPYLSYHLANFRWKPDLGWASVVFLAAAAAAAALLRGISVLADKVPANLRAVLWAMGWLALGASYFWGVGYLPARKELVRSIICIEADSGRLLWQCEGLNGPEGDLHVLNSPATPTPVIENGRVYAYFGSVGVMCADLDGRRVWVNRDVRFASTYGVGASPVAHDGVLVIANSQPEHPQVVALDCRDGCVLWRHDLDDLRGRASGNSRTPMIASTAKRNTVVIWGHSSLAGYDLHSGEQRWSYAVKDAGGDMVSSLVADGGALYAAGPLWTFAADLSKLGSAQDPVLWTARGRGPNCASPVLCGGMLFSVSQGGVARCINASTGKFLWCQRLEGNYYASPVAIGDRVYFFSLDGRATVVAAKGEFHVLAQNELGEQILASPAPVDGRLIVRTKQRVLCIEENYHARAQSPHGGRD
jgi:outer membrane protein assembly factor BamB